MKPTIFVLTTGGTIGHSSGKDGVAVMDFDPARLVDAIALPDADIEFRSILRKGSMDIGPDDWVTIARAVADAMHLEPLGIVILHGTDTMHYTAAALSFMLRDLGAPVVMTGSMIPGGDSDSDAMANLRDAVVVAAQADFAEVCIVFSADASRTKGVIIRGCQARKVHSHSIDAFASINAPPIGTILGNSIVRSSLVVRQRGSSPLSLAPALDRNVVLIKLTPNLEPGTLARLLEGASGAVLEGTGVGHIKTSLQPVVAQFGRPTVVGTQALHGGERLGSYDVDRNILAIPNVIPAGGMTSEAALVKLMWALKQGGDVGSIMRTNLAGEIGRVGH
jgi:glutamyl-tRNA(Gln) amidotransferase subunit D